MVPSTLIWHWVRSNLDATWIRIPNPKISNTLSRDITLIRGLFDEPSVLGDLPPTMTSFSCLWFWGLVFSLIGGLFFGFGLGLPFGLGPAFVPPPWGVGCPYWATLFRFHVLSRLVFAALDYQ